MNIVINDNDNFGNNIDDHHITGGPGLEGGRRRGRRRHLRGARALCQKSLKSTSTGCEDIHCSLIYLVLAFIINKLNHFWVLLRPQMHFIAVGSVVSDVSHCNLSVWAILSFFYSTINVTVVNSSSPFID